MFKVMYTKIASKIFHKSSVSAKPSNYQQTYYILSNYLTINDSKTPKNNNTSPQTPVKQSLKIEYKGGSLF